MTAIAVASIELKETRSVIITTDGRRLGIWTDQMDKLGIEQGGTYEVETQAKEVNGRTLTNIVKAKRIANAAPGVPQGLHNPCKDEQIFVLALLKSLIEAGEIKNDKTQLWATTQMLRGLWKHSFGFVEPAQGLQAAE